MRSSVRGAAVRSDNCASADAAHSQDEVRRLRRAFVPRHEQIAARREPVLQPVPVHHVPPEGQVGLGARFGDQTVDRSIVPRAGEGRRERGARLSRDGRFHQVAAPAARPDPWSGRGGAGPRRTGSPTGALWKEPRRIDAPRCRSARTGARRSASLDLGAVPLPKPPWEAGRAGARSGPRRRARIGSSPRRPAAG